MKLIDKYALVAEIKRLLAFYSKEIEDNKEDPWAMDIAKRDILQNILSFLDTIEVKEADIDKLCEFRKNIGFAYPESASEYQKQLACYRQGIKDVIKAQKGEEV